MGYLLKLSVTFGAGVHGLKPRGIYGLGRKNIQEHLAEERTIRTQIVIVEVRSAETQIP